MAIASLGLIYKWSCVMKENKLMAPGMAIDLIAQQDWLERTAGAVQPAVIRAFKAGGRAGRKIKNFLHGSWNGHPLHPALTDAPLGAWTVAFVFDVMAICARRRARARRAIGFPTAALRDAYLRWAN